MLLLIVCSLARQRTPFPPMMLMLFSVHTNIHKHGIFSLSRFVACFNLTLGWRDVGVLSIRQWQVCLSTIHTTTTTPWMAKCTQQNSHFSKSPVCQSTLAKIVYARRITQGFIVKDGKKARFLSLSPSQSLSLFSLHLLHDIYSSYPI